MKNTPQSEATAKSLRAFPAEVSSFLTAGEGASASVRSHWEARSVITEGPELKAWAGQGEANRLDGKKPVMLTKKMLAVSVQNSSLWE